MKLLQRRAYGFKNFANYVHIPIRYSLLTSMASPRGFEPAFYETFVCSYCCITTCYKSNKFASCFVNIAPRTILFSLYSFLGAVFCPNIGVVARCQQPSPRAGPCSSRFSAT